MVVAFDYRTSRDYLRGFSVNIEPQLMILFEMRLNQFSGERYGLNGVMNYAIMRYHKSNKRLG